MFLDVEIHWFSAQVVRQYFKRFRRFGPAHPTALARGKTRPEPSGSVGEAQAAIFGRPQALKIHWEKITGGKTAREKGIKIASHAIKYGRRRTEFREVVIKTADRLITISKILRAKRKSLITTPADVIAKSSGVITVSGKRTSIDPGVITIYGASVTIS